MDIFSILFGWYFENIERGIKWCFSNGRFLKACAWYMGFVLFGFATWYSHYNDKIEQEEKKQAAIMEKIKEERLQRERERERAFKVEVEEFMRKNRGTSW